MEALRYNILYQSIWLFLYFGNRRGVFFFRILFFVLFLFLKHCFSVKKTKQQQQKGVIFYVLKSVALLVHFKFINIIISKTFWNCHCCFKDILSLVLFKFQLSIFFRGCICTVRVSSTCTSTALRVLIVTKTNRFSFFYSTWNRIQILLSCVSVIERIPLTA